MSRLFYPQCVAVLQVVFDDFGSDGSVNRDASADLEDFDADETSAMGESGHPVVIPVRPKACTIHRNSYRQADSYELTFDAGDLPFDPRIIRAGEAEIYMFQTDALIPTSSVLSRRDPLSDPDPSAQAPRDPMDTLALELGARAATGKATYKNPPTIAGLWDRSNLELSSDGKWVTINGQDYTGLLAALQWKPNPDGTARRIPIGKRVDLMLADVLAEADPSGKLQIEVRDLDPAELPIVGANEVRGSARGIPVEQKTSYWDVIYNTATRVGLIAFVDGVDIVLTSPKSATANDTGRIKQLMWGYNIEHLQLEREFGKGQAPTMVARGYDEKTTKTIEVQYPSGQVEFGKRQPHVSEVKVRGTQKRAKTTERHRAHAAKSKGKVTTTIRERDEYRFIPCYGISDRSVLERIARSTYQLLGRGERRVVVTTHDLRDSARQPNDLLKVVAGDSVLITWDEFNSEMLQNPNVSEAEKIDHLVVRGYKRSVAQVIARRFLALPGIDRPLRVDEATLTWDVDDGITVELQLHDFVMVDGIRPGDGAPAPTRAARRDLRDNDGKLIGWTQDRRDDIKRRNGK